MAETTEVRVTKKDLAALERVFAAEIEGRHVYQTKAKVFQALCDKGLLQPAERVYGTGWSAVTVRGYSLTHAGRFLYCSTCDDEELPDA